MPAVTKQKWKWDSICGTWICFCCICYYAYTRFSNIYININLSATIGRAIFIKMCELWYVFLLFQNNWAHWTLYLFIAITRVCILIWAKTAKVKMVRLFVRLKWEWIFIHKNKNLNKSIRAVGFNILCSFLFANRLWINKKVNLEHVSSKGL